MLIGKKELFNFSLDNMLDGLGLGEGVVAKIKTTVRDFGPNIKYKLHRTLNKNNPRGILDDKYKLDGAEMCIKLFFDKDLDSLDYLLKKFFSMSENGPTSVDDFYKLCETISNIINNMITGMTQSQEMQYLFHLCGISDSDYDTFVKFFNDTYEKYEGELREGVVAEDGEDVYTELELSSDQIALAKDFETMEHTYVIYICKILGNQLSFMFHMMIGGLDELVKSDDFSRGEKQLFNKIISDLQLSEIQFTNIIRYVSENTMFELEEGKVVNRTD